MCLPLAMALICDIVPYADNQMEAELGTAMGLTMVGTAGVVWSD